ncbi:MAG: hypothetical protein ACLRXQ_12225 [Phascolarctobacterium faecium]
MQPGYECRESLVHELQEKVTSKIEEHNHAVGHCQRCRSVIGRWFPNSGL